MKDVLPFAERNSREQIKTKNKDGNETFKCFWWRYQSYRMKEQSQRAKKLNDAR